MQKYNCSRNSFSCNTTQYNIYYKSGTNTQEFSTEGPSPLAPIDSICTHRVWVGPTLLAQITQYNAICIFNKEKSHSKDACRCNIMFMIIIIIIVVVIIILIITSSNSIIIMMAVHSSG